VAVINETLSRKYFAKGDAIGRKIKFNIFDELPGGPKDAYFEIVGIVTDFKNNGLQDAPMPQAFIPYTITGFRERAILVRTATDPFSMVKSVSQEIWAVDHNIALDHTGSLESYLYRFSYARPEFGLKTLGAFAGTGLLLTVIGIFSVMAYTVSLQTHEIGIRMALGAQQTSILKMILTKGIRPVVAGILIGLVASYALTRFLASQIWGISTTDPWTFAGVAMLAVIVCLVACLLPARRAARGDPLVALRYE
jgi:putative ABC transport system permease protein